jgi:hypothetical protein
LAGEGRALVVAYNHPDDDDASVARVVTVWRRA